MQGIGYPLHQHLHARRRPDREVHEQVSETAAVRFSFSFFRTALFGVLACGRFGVGVRTAMPH